MKKSILIISCFLSLSACNHSYSVYLRSYVSTYYEVENIYLYQQFTNSIAITTYDGERMKYTYIVSYQSKGEDKGIYDELCLKHNDMSYNREINVLKTDNIIPHEYLATDFVSVDIVSSSDFNESHLSGESLADITIFCSVSPAPYINSGYKIKYDWEEANDLEMEIKNAFYYVINNNANDRHPIAKLVSELTPNDLYLLGGGLGNKLAYLKLIQEPTLSKNHTFTVTLISDDNRVFSDTIEMTFD